MKVLAFPSCARQLPDISIALFTTAFLVLISPHSLTTPCCLDLFFLRGVCPMSFPCQRSQSPSHCLCTHLRGHFCLWR